MDFKKKTKKQALSSPNHLTTQLASPAGGLSNYPTIQLSNFKCGLTLVELLIGMAILAFVSLMVASVYLAHFRLFSNQSTSIDVASQNRIALDEIINQIREGNGVSSTASVTGCGGAKTSGTSPSPTVVVKLWPLDPTTGDPFDPGNAADSYYDFILYCKDASNNLHKVIKKTTTGTSKRTDLDKILATGATTLQFTYDLAPPATTQVVVQLAIEAKNYDKKQTYTTDQTGKAILRNK